MIFSVFEREKRSSKSQDFFSEMLNYGVDFGNWWGKVNGPCDWFL